MFFFNNNLPVFKCFCLIIKRVQNAYILQLLNNLQIFIVYYNRFNFAWCNLQRKGLRKLNLWVIF